MAKNVTARSAHIVARAEVKIGQIVICYLEDLGLLPGRVTELHLEHFVIGFSLKEVRSNRVTAQLEWTCQQASRNAELRRAPRIVPLHRDIEVRLGEQLVLSGTILNLSMSGAAIGLSETEKPFVGGRVRAGERFSTVVRLTETGIAVQFDTPFSPDNFDERVRL